MRSVKQENRIINVLLLLMITITSYFLFQAPLEQVNKSNPKNMKILMNSMVKEIQLLQQQHSKLPEQKHWKKALSPYMYSMDYDVYVWNEKQQGVYYANMNEQVPQSLKNPLNNAIIKEPTPSTSDIQFISYLKNKETRYGYYVYIPEWKVYVSLTGTNAYFKNPTVMLWESILIEVIMIFFAIGVHKEVLRKQYATSFDRIATIIERDYQITLSSIPKGINEYEYLANQLESHQNEHSQERNGA